MPEPALVCAGNVTLDVAVAPDGTTTSAVGGDALYAALAAAHHLADVRVLAPLGTDVPAGALAALAAVGLDLDPCPRRELVSVANTVTYAGDGTRRWHLVTGQDHFEAMSVHPHDVPESALAADGVLVLAMTLASQCALVPWWRERSAAVRFLDLQEDYVAGNEDALRALVGASDVVLPSEGEAVALVGGAGAADAARRLLDLGPGVAVVTRAEHGCVVAARSLGRRVVEVPAAPLDARGLVDPTGAGDSFAGAFAAARLRGADPVEAARAAASTAALAVAAPGWTSLLPAGTGALA